MLQIILNNQISISKTICPNKLFSEATQKKFERNKPKKLKGASFPSLSRSVIRVKGEGDDNKSVNFKGYLHVIYDLTQSLSSSVGQKK